MSDLISRSEVIDLLYKTFDEYRIATNKTSTLGGFGSEVFKRVREMPTVYDIDKVVEKLEENSSRYTKKYNTPYGNNGYRDVKAISVHKAIEIVKQGGVSDDVCKYKIKDKMIYASCNNKQIASEFCWFNECGDYKYCPYCGKKIKVVR